MADQKISSRSAIDALADTDKIPVGRASDSSNPAMTGAQLKEFVRDTIAAALVAAAGKGATVAVDDPGDTITIGTLVDRAWRDVERAYLKNRMYVRHECFGATSDTENLWQATGTGATNSASGNADPGNHPGIVKSSTGSTNAGTAGVQCNTGINILLGNGEARYIGIHRVPTLSDGTETFTIRLGILDAIFADPTDGCFFRYTHSVNGGKWECVTRSNNTETAVDSGNTVPANTFQRFNITVNAAGTSVLFEINDVTVATITTNIPTGAGRQTGWGHGILKSAGTTSRGIDCDYWEMEVVFTTPR